MKLFFVNRTLSTISDGEAKILQDIKGEILAKDYIEEVIYPEVADAIIIQEDSSTYKGFRYIKELESDPITFAYPEKVFTINTDDSATGLLRGLYTGLPRSRFNPRIYKSVPYMYFPNELAFSQATDDFTPTFLASWRGNAKSNSIRKRMIDLLIDDDRFCIQMTDSWLNHKEDEKLRYVDLIRSSKFSLCPAGWAPVSFRIYESMALGRCPVIIADNFVPPKGPKWRDFALFYQERKISGLSSYLLKNEHLAFNLGYKALEAWNNYFGAAVIKQYYANALVSLIKLAPKTTRETEIKRWRSFKLQWDNKWTISQRALNRLNKIVGKYKHPFRKEHP
ncbi:exostosin domain-containing protein [Flavisolibacter tropicus]|uniref:Exostosin GT47 domain-containing protein n=1 Tax=Flavisolibacter tropicus TaxID=1492898 RepID=A0A172TR18_9BACT|nr:exostosin family protein [Flavisolibacter tropicus]ANE49257.1 hypothetical protein SY85_00800 [Flavisolibacter tropicus]